MSKPTRKQKDRGLLAKYRDLMEGPQYGAEYTDEDRERLREQYSGLYYKIRGIQRTEPKPPQPMKGSLAMTEALKVRWHKVKGTTIPLSGRRGRK